MKVTDPRIKQLLQPPPDEQIFTVTKQVHLPAVVTADVVAESCEQAFDIAKYDLVS